MHDTGEPVLHTACPETAQLNCKHWLMLFVKALHAAFACGAEYVLSGMQSKKDCPTPF